MKDCSQVLVFANKQVLTLKNPPSHIPGREKRSAARRFARVSRPRHDAKRKLACSALLCDHWRWLGTRTRLVDKILYPTPSREKTSSTTRWSAKNAKKKHSRQKCSPCRLLILFFLLHSYCIYLFINIDNIFILFFVNKRVCSLFFIYIKMLLIQFWLAKKVRAKRDKKIEKWRKRGRHKIFRVSDNFSDVFLVSGLREYLKRRLLERNWRIFGLTLKILYE